MATIIKNVQNKIKESKMVEILQKHPLLAASLKNLLELFQIIIIAFIISFLISHFLFFNVTVVGQSMEPTYYEDDKLFASALAYEIEEPERFDVAIINTQYGYCLIKRVIGLPGETIQIDNNGNIYINGEILEENYGAETIEDPGIAAGSGITLADDEYFVLGDNRNHSSDSRIEVFGPIKIDQIMGKVKFKF